MSKPQLEEPHYEQKVLDDSGIAPNSIRLVQSKSLYRLSPGLLSHANQRWRPMMIF